METETLTKKIQSIIDWKKNGFLRVNHEYQRAPVWSRQQKQFFIDSIFRGYSIPAFYFHFKATVSDGMDSKVYWIIDGQQRVNAISEYRANAFKLPDPKKGDEFKFPSFVKKKESPWAGKRFDELTPELQEQMLEHRITVYKIKTDEDDEVRDLFIRLQGGTPLSSQDKRDAWPGKFTEYILKIGGKQIEGQQETVGHPGHEFFTRNFTATGGKRRVLAAQTYMLYAKRRKGDKKIADIGSNHIDRFYLENFSFDEKSPEAERYEKVIKSLADIFRNKQKPVGHQAIHLFLLVDSMIDEYSKGWEDKLPKALHEFKSRCDEADKARRERKESEYPDYAIFMDMTRTGSDKSDTIQRRHEFFVTEMLKIIPNISENKKDPERAFGQMERETIFFRDDQQCQVGLMRGDPHKVPWEDAEIHHVHPHSEGGATILENGALVCKRHHPKSRQGVEDFARWWEEKKEKGIPDPLATESAEPRRGNAQELPLDGAE